MNFLGREVTLLDQVQRFEIFPGPFLRGLWVWQWRHPEGNLGRGH